MNKLKVGINATIVGARRNSFTYYTENILPRLVDLLNAEIDIVGGKTIPANLLPAGQIHRLRFALGAGDGKAALVNRYLWQYLGMKNYEKKHKISVWYAPTHHGRLGSGVPQVVTIHDLIALRFPEQNPPQTMYFNKSLPKLLAGSTSIIVNSHTTKQDVVTTYGIDESKVKVVYLGFESSSLTLETMSVPNNSKDVILVPGAGFPHKNAAAVIEAYSLLSPRTRQKFRLVITGAGTQKDSLEAAASKYGVRERIRVCTYLSPAEMTELWNKTRVMVYASLWEGFGIPPLEAMSRGIPSIVSNVASLPEVCGDAAIYVNPLDVEDISRTIDAVVNEQISTETVINSGYERINKYSWSEAVEQIKDIILKAAD